VKVGQGQLAFELVEGWERLPAGFSHPDVAAVCTDEDGRVYLYCRGEHPVMIYDRDGNFVDSWGEGRFGHRTHGMYMAAGGVLYLVDDGGNSVTRHRLDGTETTVFGPKGVPTDTGYNPRGHLIERAAGPYNRPTNVAVSPTGEVFVADGYGNSRVHRFDAAGSLLESWGEPGSGPGEFRVPHGIWVHDDGRILVADRQNERIQVFGPDGSYLTEWTDVQRPQDLFVDKDGLVYVAELGWSAGELSYRRGVMTEPEPGRVSVLDPQGNVLLRWSDPDPYKPGFFIAPHGIWVDDEGSIYLAEVTDTVGVALGRCGPDAHTFQKFARV
jgi:DNA-binding beta-propeller fold protein YncE